jgi:hypothetical protein
MASYLGRRKLLATLGGAAVAWPLAARASDAISPTTDLSWPDLSLLKLC